MGTVETVAKIDRADLMYARERFLNADNATIVVIGGVEQTRLRRTLRQLLGPWQKGDRLVPATFRQPSAPDVRVLVVNQTGATKAEIRLAVRGLARSDRDATAASILAQISVRAVCVIWRHCACAHGPAWCVFLKVFKRTISTSFKRGR